MEANNWTSVQGVSPQAIPNPRAKPDGGEEVAEELSRTNEILEEILDVLHQLENTFASTLNGRPLPPAYASSLSTGARCRQSQLQSQGQSQSATQMQVQMPMHISSQLSGAYSPTPRGTRGRSRGGPEGGTENGSENGQEGPQISLLPPPGGWAETPPGSAQGPKRPPKPATSFEEPYGEFLRTLDRHTPNAGALLEYLTTFCEQRRKMSTLQQLRSVLKQFCAQSAVPPTQQDFANYIRGLMKKSALSSLKQLFAIVKRFLQTEFGWAESDFPTLSVTDPAQKRRLDFPPRSLLNRQDVARLLALAVPRNGYPAHLAPLIGLMYTAGLRAEEATALSWSSLKQVMPGRYFVEVAHNEPGTSPGSSALVPIPADLAKSLLQLRASSPSETLMFGTDPQLPQHFLALSQALGKKVTPNDIKAAEGGRDNTYLHSSSASSKSSGANSFLVPTN